MSTEKTREQTGPQTQLARLIDGDLRRDEMATKTAVASARSLVARRYLELHEAIRQESGELPQISGAVSIPEGGFSWFTVPGIILGQVGEEIPHPGTNGKGQYIFHSVMVLDWQGAMVVYPDGADDGLDFDQKRAATDEEVLQMKRAALLAIKQAANERV